MGVSAWIGRGFTLPWVVRLPLVAAVLIFAAAVGTTQTAVGWMFGRQADQTLGLASAVLDTAAAAVQPYVALESPALMQAALARLLAAAPGLDVRTITVLRPDGSVQAEAGAPERPPPGLTGQPGRFLFDADGDGAWLARSLSGTEPVTGWIAVHVDLATLYGEQRSLRAAMAGLDLLLSACGALLGYLLVKRMLRPVVALTGRIEAAQRGLPELVPDRELPPPGTEFGRLLRGFNRMVVAAQEREHLAAQLAEQDKAAVLGRLAATVAHEVRNPLGGLINTVDTLKSFGDDPTVRAQSLSLLERGLVSIGEVVRAVLDTYRAPPQGRTLGADDFADLRLLTEPEATRRRVALDWSVDVPERLPVDAVQTRQIVLNLLLNACAATPPGGRVRFTAGVDEGALRMAIADEGPGLPEPVAGRLTAPTAAASEPGNRFGIAVVVRLVETLNGRVSVRSSPGAGTEIALTLPFATEEATP
ncbi:HAMP domain-containing histidine kinase [Azospirillum sp. RWY-5-1]|uniref:histidine kinase n=1 Tax=Azospirillum oleiclasticum TaxID=2735135 RepID=A0ABX2THX4_9PROT|nr:HAMP domain-containing sensor histidine kinase [Azospirillum oleiclasticum]NYZ14734.1 HAMP domain-containing histidine kinase [Azospirillum oleiclasticum]NYZ22280.1 HAMP domain-containing histidine kinase [Azospirillum oleiclasticum]